ncbi:MAG: hypothetical protein ACYDAL_04200 [Candidatus Dormibacteraceae bacterium]
MPRRAEPKALVEGPNLKVDGPVMVTGDPSEHAKSMVKDPGARATRILTRAIDLFRRAGVFGVLADQLKSDGLSVSITIVVRVDDRLASETPPISAHTECGDSFVGIDINASAILEPWRDEILDSLWDTLAHELIHAKQCAYQKAGKALPYGDHDSDAFKKKTKELVQLAKERADRDIEAWADAMKQALGK